MRTFDTDSLPLSMERASAVLPCHGGQDTLGGMSGKTTTARSGEQGADYLGLLSVCHFAAAFMAFLTLATFFPTLGSTRPFSCTLEGVLLRRNRRLAA